MKPKLGTNVDGVETALPVLEDLPGADLAIELAEDLLGASLPRLPSGKWAVEANVSGIRLFATGDNDTWEIRRPPESDESDATAAASKLHATIGWRHSEWDADR
jgi:hypothetical protein